jgi:ADP-ribose pyrophosphatase
LHEDDVLINNELVQKHVYIEYPESILVVPFLDDATVLMVRQYRYVLSAWNLEFPGGIIDHGEQASGAAQRELEEETGFHARRLLPIIKVYPDPSNTTQRVHVFFATGLQRSAPSRGADELIENASVSLLQLADFINAGQIIDGVTLIAALLALK